MVLLAVSSFLTTPPRVSAEIPVSIGSPIEQYLRVLAIDGRADRPYLNYRTNGTSRWRVPNGQRHPWEQNLTSSRTLVQSGETSISLQPVEVHSSFNSGYPDGGNDGPAWQGRGFNLRGQLGADLSIGPARLTMAPTVWFAENRGFPLLPSASSFHNEYAYFTNNIDLPQRFGDDPITNVALGESEIRYSHRWFTAALSNQSLWMGPTEHNPVLVGNNAGGFPRIEIGARPTSTVVGDIEAYAWWGNLRQSDYFDVAGIADERLFSGISLSYEPPFVPGFTLGVHRVVLVAIEDLDAEDYLEVFNPFMTPELGRDSKDQRASITLDWLFQDLGFNVYAEWGKNDYSARWSHIIRAPEHSQAFTYGIRQILYSDARQLWILNGEISQFIHSRDYDIDLGKSQSGFYTHGTVKQGHTHNGQLLAAEVGPGADSQTLTVDYYSPLGRIGGFIERTSRNKDYIYGDSSSGPGDIERMNVEMRYGISSDVWLPHSVLISSGFSVARNWNRNYESGNRTYNLRGTVGVVYGY